MIWVVDSNECLSDKVWEYYLVCSQNSPLIIAENLHKLMMLLTHANLLP